MKSPPFTFTNESITVIWEGKPHVVQKGTPHFLGLRNAIIDERWSDIPNHLTVAKGLKEWAKGKFTIDDGENFFFEKEKLPRDINERIIEMATKGESPMPLFHFYERLQKNPSMRSVEQLYPFLKHSGIPFTADGCFLAYKGVNGDYTDCRTGKVSNMPGVTNEMPRNKISDDPNHACHEGFHVGALKHASSYGTRTIICKVAPEDVVCVPYDSSHQKMRVCKYVIVGNKGDTLPSTLFEEIEEKEEVEVVEPAPKPLPDEEKAVKGRLLVTLHEKPVLDGAALAAGDVERVPDKSPSPPPPEPLEAKLETAGKLKIPEKFNKLAMMPLEGLMAQSLDTLRQFATYGLKIVGASKIPGGKTSLVARIIEVRGTTTKSSEG